MLRRVLPAGKNLGGQLTRLRFEVVVGARGGQREEIFVVHKLAEFLAHQNEFFDDIHGLLEVAHP